MKEGVKRLAIAFLLSLTTSIALYAMSSHGASLYYSYGWVYCRVWHDGPGELPPGSYGNYRQVEIWLFGPNNELLASRQTGATNPQSQIYTSAAHEYIGPGTYSCNVHFLEYDDYSSYIDYQNDDWSDAQVF